MKLVTAESSMIRAVGYDQKTLLLEVIFDPGQTYCYEDVPPITFRCDLSRRRTGGREDSGDEFVESA